MDTPTAPAADPRPPAAPYRGFDRRAYRDPRPSAALIRAVGWLNRLLVLPWLTRLASFDLPRADLARLRAAVRPGTAAFLGPNHPEFFTDWMIDKELSFRVSPLMAHWASYEIVNVSPLAQWLWLRNNLIANVPGGGGREYSIRWALAGHGVLLHPEGTASLARRSAWARSCPGIVDLAWETCARARAGGPGRARLRRARSSGGCASLGDVSCGLAREMAHIERALELPAGAGLPVEERFAALQANLLRRQCEALGLPARPRRTASPARTTSPRRTRPPGPSPASWSRAARGWSTTSPASCTAPAGRPAPGSSVPSASATAGSTWSCGGWRASRARSTTRPRSPRRRSPRTSSASARCSSRGAGPTRCTTSCPCRSAAASPTCACPSRIAVHEAFAAGGDAGAAKARLLETLHARLQGTLDALNAELAPLLGRFRRPNPLWTGRGAEAQPGQAPGTGSARG